MATSAKFGLKLLVDEKRNKVVLAEADQDFVDVLISLLSLPMGKIARLLENHKDLQTVLACYQNLNRSVVKCRSSFIVTDDLKVSVNSICVIMNVLNDLGFTDFSDLQETLLDIGFEEVLTLLGCFFTSETPLTCAFLRKPCMTRELTMLPAHVQNPVEPCSAFSVKVFVRKFDKEILYAECNEDFADALLSFLIFPLELACSLSSDNTILGCVRKLCRSPCRRASASNFYQVPDYYSCSNNNMFGYLPSTSPVYECFVPRNSSDSWSCQMARQIQRSMNLLFVRGDIVKMSPNNPKVISGRSSGCDTGFVKKNTKFIVSNDLSITPMNSFSTVGMLKKMQVNISDLEEHQISISRAELISILRASLVSSSALTNGLSNLLAKKPKEET